MREEFVKQIEGFIEEAKELIKKKTKYGLGYDSSRKWQRLKAHYDVWSDGSQDMEIIMFEGSPAKGYILVNWGTGTVRAFVGRDTPLKKWQTDTLG